MHPTKSGEGARQQEPRARRGQLWCCSEMSSSALLQPHSILQSPRPGLPARDLPAGLSRGAEEQQHPLGPLVLFLGTRPGCLCCSHQLLAASPALIPVWALEGMGEALRCFRNVPARAARVDELSLTTPTRSRNSRTPLPSGEAPVPPDPIPGALPAAEFRP